jgi:hypothetical protein
LATKRSRTGASAASDRKHVGLTVPRPVKLGILAGADALDWSAGDWVLAAAAEHGATLRKRPRIEDAAFTALYLTPDERDELDETAVACGLNRSAFVTAVARLALGDDLADVVAPLQAATSSPRVAPNAPATRATAVTSDTPATPGTAAMPEVPDIG